MKPVYMINGFLESGKTEFISFTLDQPYFATRGTTLLICCEEGENEYDATLLRKTQTVLEMIEDEEDFTPEKLAELEKKHNPKRIIIEYNGMWNYKDMKLPWYWKIEQQITVVDGSTFQTYFANMRSLFAEMIRKSEMIIVNRCDGLNDQLNSYKRNIKTINPQADVIFEDSKGEIDEIFEEDLPYDLNSDVIELDDYGFQIWFLDMMDHLERYEGKTVKYLAMVMKPEKYPKGYFVPGRMAMTCCAQDMSFLGFACQYEKLDELKQKQWIKVTAVVKKEYWEEYKDEGPVLHAVAIEPAKAPRDEVLNFGAPQQ